VPKEEPPRPKPQPISLPEVFRRVSRRLTRRFTRRRIRSTIRGAFFYRPQIQVFGTASNEVFGWESPTAGETSRAGLREMRTIGNPPSLPKSNDNMQTDEADDRVPGDVPDVSPELRSEIAALLAFFAARIGAARRSLSRGTADAIVMAIVNEQTVALRALMERWQAAIQKQRAERPKRPIRNAQQQKGNDSKLS
jgi:hypothetical protein